MQAMGSSTDILVLPFFGQGHLFPCSELCKQFTFHNCKSILIIPSHLSSSIPSDLHKYPSVEVVLIESSSSPSPPPPPPPNADPSAPGTRHYQYHELGRGIESFVSGRYPNVRPAFVVIDVLMSWTKDIFKKMNIPFVSFFTSGACATAMEYAASKPDNADQKLPEGIAMSDTDIKRRDRRRKDRGDGRGGKMRGGSNSGPPRSMKPKNWMDETQGSAALLINTCDEFGAPFLKYLTGQVEKPVFGVGPLLPEMLWKSIGSVVHDRDSRPDKESNYTEDEVMEWLDSKPRRSVIYVSFGSEVGPSVEEYDQLADALAETDKSFIWVIQPRAGKSGPPANMFSAKDSSDSEEEGYEPHGLEERVGNRGLIIKGWAPQLLILSHPSTGGFLSHCGWNSTMEAICCGVPILAWPIRGDQFYDANLLAKYLNVGHKVHCSDDLTPTVKKADIKRGIELVMGDGEARDRLDALRGIFQDGYPASSAASLKALIEIISK